MTTPHFPSSSSSPHCTLNDPEVEELTNEGHRTRLGGDLLVRATLSPVRSGWQIQNNNKSNNNKVNNKKALFTISNIHCTSTFHVKQECVLVFESCSAYIQ